MADLLKLAIEVRKVKKAGTNVGPSGLCFDWNLSLARRLRREGAPVRFCYGKFRTDDGQMRTHYWAVVGEDVYDITGDQFNRQLTERWPEVYVGPAGDRYHEEEDQTAERM